ncbi:hypothetical protein N0V94_005449 [Neodidymelliopsis sp. IMI 364377]|nr:hypothetical protein N0V94_005449 [Neodidymelliopsis sp. IMI 364377]
MAPTEPMDLIDIATLLNYERVSREPRFRHTKFVHITRPDEYAQLRHLQNTFPSKLLKKNIPNSRTWIAVKYKKGDDEQPDLPSNMTDKNAPPISPVTDEELEAIYYRVRHQDGCFSSAYLLQCFFDLFPEDTPLRVRHEPRDAPIGAFSYTTTISHRMGISDKLVYPKNSTAVIIDNNAIKDNFQLAGHERLMNHAHLGFSPPGSESTMSLLDLSSMQFGNVGRGPGRKGKMPFAMDHAFEWEYRWRDYALGHQEREFFKKLFACYYPEDTTYLQEVARRAKERWEKRDTEKWCACCEAPQPKFKCGGCGEVWFCDRKHQKNVWPFHKGYCNKEPIGISVKDMEAIMESRQCPEDRAKPSKKST